MIRFYVPVVFERRAAWVFMVAFTLFDLWMVAKLVQSILAVTVLRGQR